MSRSKASRRRKHLAAIEAAQKQFGPDGSVVVYEFEDGWTVRYIPSEREATREGTLLGHCLGGSRGPDLFAILNDPAVENAVLSLRDPDGFPVMTWVHNPISGWSYEAGGQGGGKPKPEHLERVQEWHRSLPHQAQWVDADGGWAPELDLATSAEVIAARFEEIKRATSAVSSTSPLPSRFVAV